ncbi:MAG: carboxymuconolactone decarboxylase family protein [Trueperaceae bacterium]|nr:carboxymuconolactone decarboxylase family protein [Trueperaceae bacterium]MCC6310222.1 carboxymuconolactone decarboxylase family protein [Trueperaceae bacterium]MCO5173222.1 carboxymuconolactone decarboxylase family protein [Trueperaceae bacterium]MCW5818671.1 carboxymuconolactone decarboxylase family protein [Trueperaceae bacterium]
MHERIDYAKASPAVLEAMVALERACKRLGIERSLYELVKIRASQLNGCAYCLAMHTKDARAAGESDERLDLLAAWREAEGVYTERERAALAWTEVITLLPDVGAPDDAYEAALAQFGGGGLADLTLLIVTINGWNRFGVGFALRPGR